MKRLLSNINEMLQVVEIGMALQDRRLTAAEASEAISRVGQNARDARDEWELVSA